MITYFSNAEWPKDSDITDEYGEHRSKDSHHSVREALSVCKLLERDGLGGDGQIFPVRTWVSDNAL